MTKLPAPAVYLTIAGCTTLLLEMMSTVEGVYKVTVVGLNPLQLVLLGTSLEIAVFLFEVPTGVVADLYSRRLSVIIGLVVMGAASVLFGSIPTFAALLVAEVLWGIGYTFTSGADAAWITDEAGESEAARLFLRATRSARWARSPASSSARCWARSDSPCPSSSAAPSSSR